MRFVRLGLGLILTLGAVAVVLGYFAAYWPLRVTHPATTAGHGVLAVTGARIYMSPDAEAIENGTVVVRDGVIAAVGKDVEVPAGAQLIHCDGCVVTAGFWNAHVHFTEDKWTAAEWKSAATLQSQVQDMLTSRGFTTVVDTGSNLRNTVPLRRRIESGEVMGPKIYTAGAAQYPPHGLPFYIREHQPAWLQRLMPQPESPEEAAKVEEQNIRNGADVLKLFTGSYVERGRVLPMPVEHARAAVKVAHAHGQLAFAHESDVAGVKVAMESGVDVLAHAADTTDGVDDGVLQAVVARHMAMVPTLKMFKSTVTTKMSYLGPIYAQVRRFHELGGELIFGTDVGYMTDYDTADEFAGLGLSGLNGRDVLRMLTTSPAGRFGVSGKTGTVEVGKAGDLVVLGRDPMSGDLVGFADVRATVRNGRVIWQK